MPPSSTVATVAVGHPDYPSAAPRCQLVVVEGPDMGRAAAIGGAATVVGTDPACDLVLRDNRVSRRHMSVETGPDGHFVVTDLGSKNGTLYQGAAVGRLSAPPGAALRLGRTTLRIQPAPQALALEPSRSRRFGDLVGESLVMREVFAVLELAAAGDVSVLLEGSWPRGRSTAPAPAPAAPSSPSTAAPCPRAWWRASSSAT